MPVDPRVKLLTDAAVAVTGDYNPHFSNPADTALMETKLFLARWDALQEFMFDASPGGEAVKKYRNDFPAIVAAYEAADKETVHLDRTKRVIVDHDGNYITIPMILWCPNCGTQHIDAAEPHAPICASLFETMEAGPCDCGRWANPPHKSHLCHNCGHIWRPADVPTTGVAEITTSGIKDHTLIRDLIRAAKPELKVTRYKSGDTVFRREECIFKYCPTVGLCLESCRHPASTRDETQP